MGDTLLHPLPFFFTIVIIVFLSQPKTNKGQGNLKKNCIQKISKILLSAVHSQSYETLQPSDTKGTEEMHHLTATALELKFTALKPCFTVKPTSLSGSCEKVGRQTPAFPRWAAFGKEEKISPARQRKSRLPDNSIKALLLFLESA